MKETRAFAGLVLAGALLACSPVAPPDSLPEPTAPYPTALIPSATPIPATVTPPPTKTHLPPPANTLTTEIPRWPVFQRGDWGQPEVFALQRLLRYHGFTVIADGKFGRQTEGAVINFQTAIGLTVDGLVGPQTWSALVEEVSLEGERGREAVRAIQYLLLHKFGSQIEVDGIFNPETTEAIKGFQASIHLPADGRASPQVWQALIALQP